jgi:hypothetical protein
MRLMNTGRAVLPPPAIAPSIHLLPVALNALANSATATDSPPDVHQCVTSRSVAEATETPPSTVAAARLYGSAFICFLPIDPAWRRIVHFSRHTTLADVIDCNPVQMGM